MIEDPRRRGLGRGLSALLGEEGGEGTASAEAPRATRALPVELLHPGRYQPRRYFDTESQQALVESIKAQGILQPLLVRRHPDIEGHYEIVAGERRWRAAQAAQLHEVPVLLRELADREALEIALVENVQRQDLNPLEEAEGYRRLLEEFRHTQEDLARVVGKSRSHITNMMRLLSLPEEVRELVSTGAISAGHARALIGLENATELAHKIVAQGMSVRQVERLAQAEARHKEKLEKPASLAGARDADTAVLERELTQLLGLKVQIVFTGQGGILSIHYKTLDQLDDVLRRLNNLPLR
ncbi:MAG TPA: ParB/RepB/Spo0J family partition protein [Stellaceae bacterium]|jgi:ParB family transcriptional regulator, chromosome partitioning protein|nr:ParB/RepB/Spo0J family partition protein [Stellaceae bacterium]